MAGGTVKRLTNHNPPQNLQINKRMQFQPQTAHSTTKNAKKFSVIRTIEKQIYALQQSNEQLNSLDNSGIALSQT